MTDVRTNPSKLGLVVVVVGIVSLLVVRFWASPVIGRIVGRDAVSVVTFLGIPFFLLVVGAGIALFVWGPELLGE